MDSNYINQLKEEIKYLEKKKVEYGWTEKDADRYDYITRKIE